MRYGDMRNALQEAAMARARRQKTTTNDSPAASTMINNSTRNSTTETAIDNVSNEELIGDEENQMVQPEPEVQYMDDGFPEYNPADFEDHPIQQPRHNPP